MIKTDKQAFEYVRAKLLEQNQQSLDPFSQCAYRGFSRETIEKILGMSMEDCDSDDLSEIPSSASDLRCAVGHLISDEFYNYSLENKAYDEYIVVDAVRKSNPEWNVTESSLKLLAILQQTHDGYFPTDWNLKFTDDNFKFTNEGKFSHRTTEEF